MSAVKTFAYDRYGNMTCQTNAQTQGLCPNYSFDQTTNRINTSGFQYDAAGDLISDGTHTYQYDGEQRTRTIDNGSTLSYTYNAEGLLVEHEYPNAWNEFLFGPGGNWLGVLANGAWWPSVVGLGSRLLAFEDRGGIAYFPHTNPLGTMTMEMYYNGAVGTDVAFYPWGEMWGHAGLVDYQWAGTIWSEGDPPMDYAAHRLYNNNVGRWLTPDPGNAGADPANPQSWNAYSYAGNNPNTNTDPSGLKCVQLDDGAFADDMTGGGCDKAGVDPNGNIRPDSVQIKAKQGSWAAAVGVNAFLEFDNIANDFFAPFIGRRPSYMQNTPTGSGIAAEVGAGAALVGTALIGPQGELEDGIRIAEGRLTKVLEAHTAGGLLSVGKSLFDNPDEVRDLIQAARSVPAVAQSGRFAGKFERVVDAGRIIGTDRTGARTSIYTVITDSNGHLVTAFPGRP